MKTEIVGEYKIVASAFKLRLGGRWPWQPEFKIYKEAEPIGYVRPDHRCRSEKEAVECALWNAKYWLGACLRNYRLKMNPFEKCRLLYILAVENVI